jgi:hypothetical protein
MEHHLPSTEDASLPPTPTMANTETKMENVVTTERTVVISKKRFEELEELERKLPLLLEEARNAYKASRLQQLREKDKADLNLVRARVRRYAEKHRDTINARRRQKRENNTVSDGGTNELHTVSNLSGCPSGVQSPEEHSETDRPRPDHGNPEEGNVGPRLRRPVALEDPGDKKADPPQPKHKTGPKKVHK